MKGSDAEEAKRTNVCHLRSRDARKARRTKCSSLSKEGSDAKEAKRAECSLLSKEGSDVKEAKRAECPSLLLGD